jgi:hypothetical protein
MKYENWAKNPGAKKKTLNFEVDFVFPSFQSENDEASLIFDKY